MSVAVSPRWKTTPCSSCSARTKSPICGPRTRSMGRLSGATTCTSISRARSAAATSSPMKLAPSTTVRRAAAARSMIARESASDRNMRTCGSSAPGVDRRTGSAPVASNSRSKGGGRYSVGALAHFLKNRFYVGDVAYRGEIHAGEHEPILDRATFDAVQSRLAECALERHAHVVDSPAILMGRIFDDRGNRMTPSHSNKAGVRYRYYVSHALLQRRKDEAGGVARVPATPVEAIVVEAVREKLHQTAA